jgi:O-antigen/teichoic acid export membrane protein
MQGDHRIHGLALFQLTPRMIYLVTVLLIHFWSILTLFKSLTVEILAAGVIIGVFFVRLQPCLAGLSQSLAVIWSQNRTYGLPVFVGSLSNVASAHLGILFVSYYIDNANVGYYCLALTMTMPIMMFPNAVGTTLYKSFVHSRRPPTNVTVFTVAITFSLLFLFFIAAKNILLTLYSSEYLPTLSLSYLTAIGFAFHGLGDYYNRFLGAHGRGKEIRNSALAQGLWNIVGFFTLVRGYQAWGAALAKCLSGIIYWASLYIYHRRWTSNKVDLTKGLPDLPLGVKP